MYCQNEHARQTSHVYVDSLWIIVKICSCVSKKVLNRFWEAARFLCSFYQSLVTCVVGIGIFNVCIHTHKGLSINLLKTLTQPKISSFPFSPLWNNKFLHNLNIISTMQVKRLSYFATLNFFMQNVRKPKIEFSIEIFGFLSFHPSLSVFIQFYYRAIIMLLTCPLLRGLANWSHPRLIKYKKYCTFTCIKNSIHSAQKNMHLTCQCLVWHMKNEYCYGLTWRIQRGETFFCK